jgi:hypothetical protein
VAATASLAWRVASVYSSGVDRILRACANSLS